MKNCGKIYFARVKNAHEIIAAHRIVCNKHKRTYLCVYKTFERNIRKKRVINKRKKNTCECLTRHEHCVRLWCLGGNANKESRIYLFAIYEYEPVCLVWKLELLTTWLQPRYHPFVLLLSFNHIYIFSFRVFLSFNLQPILFLALIKLFLIFHFLHILVFRSFFSLHIFRNCRFSFN